MIHSSHAKRSPHHENVGPGERSRVGDHSPQPKLLKSLIKQAMTLHDFDNWLNAAPSQLSRTFLRHLTDFFDGIHLGFAPVSFPGRIGCGEEPAPDPTMSEETLLQVLLFRLVIHKLEGDQNRPEATPDMRVEFSAFLEWFEQGPEWLKLTMRNTVQDRIIDGDVTIHHWAEALWVSQGHE